jgi:hypothetical protein
VSVEASYFGVTGFTLPPLVNPTDYFLAVGFAFPLPAVGTIVDGTWPRIRVPRQVRAVRVPVQNRTVRAPTQPRTIIDPGMGDE